MHRKTKWDEVIEDKMIYDNDANEYYYQWIDFEDTDLVDLFKKYIGVGIARDIPVTIKASDGKIFIEKKGGEIKI